MRLANRSFIIGAEIDIGTEPHQQDLYETLSWDLTKPAGIMERRLISESPEGFGRDRR